MPRNGRPVPLPSPASTPSRASAARPAGRIPSPHAFSTGSWPRSRTSAESPWRRAAIAVARPTGPPPTMTTSAADIASGRGLSPLDGEKAGGVDPGPRAEAGERRGEDAEAVAHRAREIDRRRFGEVLGRAGELAHAVAGGERLHQDLVVELEVVGEPVERQRLEHRPAVGAEAGVVLRELLAEEEILDQGQP